jgi:hypothetical protein
MTPDQVDLARRAVVCPRWRWMPGMRTIGDWKIISVDADGIEVVTDLGEVVLFHSGVLPHIASSLPDLTDPATLGCLLALVREAHGPATVARLVGVNGRGGQEWAICDRAPAVDGWHLAAPALGYWESEAEALVAALENGGGGA